MARSGYLPEGHRPVCSGRNRTRWRASEAPTSSQHLTAARHGRHQMAQHDDLDAPERLLTPSEVAQLFRVNPKTVTRWARAGKLTAIRTLGGHRRFRASEIQRCLEEMATEDR